MSTNITVSPSKKIITAKQIKDHFSDNKNISWIAMRQLMQDTPEQCVDGRSREGVIGTPGGNMGELILAIDAAEKVTDTWVRPNEVFYIFEKYLKKFGSFYMHTDTHGLEHLLGDLQKDKMFDDLDLKSVHDVEKLIRKPAGKYQDSLLEHLIQSQNTGCGHLKLMLSFKDEYQVRRKLIQTAVRAFYSALWRGEDLEYVVLKADHEEGAVVTVIVDESEITPDTMIPTIASMGNTCQMFISHPQAESFMRSQIAQQIAADQLIYGISTKNQDKYLETIIQRGANLTRYTLSHLALGLPHYTVTLQKD